MQSPLLAFLTSPWATVVAVGLQTVSVIGLFGYAVGQSHLIYLYIRRGPSPGPAPTPRADDGDLPFVTVQVPMYNERHVACEVMNACAAFDWPRDRLELQILDDSTDDTVQIIDERAAFWRARGLIVEVVRRTHRDGYKAGALAHGTPTARGEFLALFDADFRPHPDFLRQMMPRFADPRVGFVQARWGHINRTWSALTRAQSIVLDAFYLVEQEARHRAGLMIRFNGSAGVWRASAIADAGGWHADTLSEDYDLALRAQLRGWRGDYAVEVVAPAELPVNMLDYKLQQTRWARGRGQVMRKLLPTLWRAELRPLVKAHVIFDMLNIFTVPSILLFAFLSPWLMLVLAARPSLQPFALGLTLIQMPLNAALVPVIVWMAVRPYGRTLA
ncbi:MAG: glycosyltransferase, partial [Chloroflexota bacterium]|nr:glycosyltransferase [Chloroflexota bacterium]